MVAKKTITTIGLIIIFLSIGIGAYFVYQKGLLTTQVNEDTKPTKVRITNISSDGFTVSWVTKIATKGSIVYSQGSGKLDQVALDDRDQLTGQSGDYINHHITVRNLKASTIYQFKLRSGEKEMMFDNEGKDFSQKTAPSLGTTPATDMINGKVVSANGSGEENAMVYINIPGVTPLSTLSKKDGSWLLSLASARNSQLTNYANYDKENTIVDIFVQGKNVSSSGKTITSNKSPVPDIVLGQTFDYSIEDVATTIPEEPIVDQNIGMGQEESSKSIEEKIEENLDIELEPESSRSAELEDTEESTDSARDLESFPTSALDDVEITVPAYDSEEIEDPDLTFEGTGAPSTVITVEMDGISQGSPIEVDEDGEWQFIPDESLDEGEHIITLTYIDAYGDETTVERSFSVVLGTMTSGTGGTPKSEASSSASPTPSPTPVQYTTRSTMPSTSSGTPTSGASLPTILLLILGSSSLVLGLQYKKIFS